MQGDCFLIPQQGRGYSSEITQLIAFLLWLSVTVPMFVTWRYFISGKVKRIQPSYLKNEHALIQICYQTAQTAVLVFSPRIQLINCPGRSTVDQERAAVDATQVGDSSPGVVEAPSPPLGSKRRQSAERKPRLNLGRKRINLPSPSHLMSYLTFCFQDGQFTF